MKTGKPLITNTNKHNQDLDALEEIIDSIPCFDDFISLVAEICSEKADHVRETWQDEKLGETWDNRAAALLEISFKIREGKL